jgi:hypothetical protein
MSFKPEVIADSSGKWCGTPLRFATGSPPRKRPKCRWANLASRWLLVGETLAVECDDPVNYRWQDGQLIAVEK